MLRIIINLYLFLSYFNLYGQNEIQSQKTNVYLFNHHKLFCSSIDGILVNTGVRSVLYNSPNFNLLGSNIQSTFFPDELHRVWFSTYQALHVYIPELDDFEYEQVTSWNGDTIKSDYKVIALDGVDLYFKAGDEFFLYDVCLRQVIRRWSASVRDGHDAIMQNVEQGKRL